MTESGCAPDGYLSNYDRLAGSDTDHHRRTSFILRAVAPDAFIYCRGSSTLPTTSDLSDPGPGGNPKVRLISHSRSVYGNTSTYDTLMETWDNFVYANNILIVNSSGNTDDCSNGYVASPGRALNLATIGNYSDSNNTAASTQCYKDPTDVGNIKPELTGPGQSLSPAGTNAAGQNLSACSGTSCSTPLVAGLVANFGEAQPETMGRAAQAKAVAMMGALDPIAGGFDKVGFGGADFFTMYNAGFTQYWSGPQSSWSTWDNQDPWPNNQAVDKTFTVPSANITQVRVVISWLTRGTWTLDHRNDTFPLGVDFDVIVYAPNGSSVALNQTYYDSHAVADFDPTVSGTYRVRIGRFAYPDPLNAIRLALAVGWLPY